MDVISTLPFYACSDHSEDLGLLNRLYQSKNVTVRNDPDGRSRLNVNIFNGDIIVTDFGDTPPLGNIVDTKLTDAYKNWQSTSISKELICHCPAVSCLGPNILVKNSYYPNANFSKLANKIRK